MTIHGTQTTWDQSDVYHLIVKQLEGVNHEHRMDSGDHTPCPVVDGARGNTGVVNPRGIGLAGSGLILVLSCAVASPSWGTCKANYIDGPAGPCTAFMPRAEGASPDESKKWVSDEVAPGKGHQPDWETGAVATPPAVPTGPGDAKFDESKQRELATVDDNTGKKAVFTATVTLKGATK